MNAHQMTAQWIWTSGEERPKNFYLLVRKSFVIPDAVRCATIRLTADSRYQLLVNSVRVARGPARCDRRWQCLDRWDITREVRVGLNVVAALVHHYGEWTFSYMLGRGGFLAEVEIELANGSMMHVGTDSSWRVQPSRTWVRDLPRMSIQLGYPEVYDAREEIEGWTEPSFDDSTWVPATVLGPAGSEPWPNLIPREIPAMREVPLRPERVMETGEVGGAKTGHYVDLQRVIWSASNAVAYLATFVWSPYDAHAEIHAGSQDAMQLWVNREMLISHLVARDPGPDQEVVGVRLRSGWNVVLAKIVQGEGQWHFHFRIEGEVSDRLLYAKTAEVNSAEANAASPWWFLGPFESGGLQQGFETVYEPERSLDFGCTCRGKNGDEIRWTSAGVTSESRLTSVVMSREVRFPNQGGAFENPDGLIGPGQPALVSPGTDHGWYAVIDFGREVAGYPVIEVDRALGGEIIDLGYAEMLQTPNGEILRPGSAAGGIVNPDRAGVHYADRYICRPGRQRYQTFDKRAFRYLQMDIRNVRQPIAIGPVSLVFSTYPVEDRGSFECSDPLLNRIWAIGRYTLQLTMEDAYTDCPWRERGQWWGDARVQALVNYYAFGDLALVRQGLRQIAQSQREDGLTMGVYPTGWSYGILPTFTLLWVVSLWEYVLFSGDRVLVAELFPAVERAMVYFERFWSDHDLLRDIPHWLFVDWADVDTVGESASVNALYYGALRASARLADCVGVAGGSLRYDRLADRIRAGMRRHLWDTLKNCYRDSWKNGATTEKISEQANCWAIAFGMEQGESARAVLESILVQRKAAVHAATPYFGHYVLSALAHAGCHEQSLEYVRERWGGMLDWGATTWWEQWEPKASFCHGWSSGPTHFLQSEILGVKPGSSGWEEVLITPHPAGLGWARGSVPTPHGTVRVDWTTDNGLIVDIDVPARTSVTLPVKGAGDVSVTTPDGKEVEQGGPLPVRGGCVTVGIEKPGTYRIRSG